MARHRNVRGLNLDDEYDCYDDVTGRSYEDDCGVSPGTAEQFLYDRNRVHHPLSSFINDEILEEDEDGKEATEEPIHQPDPLQDSTGFQHPKLDPNRQGQLNTCLEEMRNVIGDSAGERVLIDVALKSDLDPERAINTILNQQEARQSPKPQRQPKGPKSKTLGPNTTIPVPSAVLLTDLSNGISQLSTRPHPPVKLTVSSSSKPKTGFEVKKDSAPIKPPTAIGVSDEIGDSSSRAKMFLIGEDDYDDNFEIRNDRRVDVLKIASSEVAAAFVMGIPSTPKRDIVASEGNASSTASLGTPQSISKSSSKARILRDKDELQKEYERRRADQGRDYINLVVIGHVDAGKSTLMGHLLYQLGFVSKKMMHKYEQESKKQGKASFAYAWVLDETDEERSRGVTMDVAQTQFKTDSKVVTLLDAPGHKDFIPNMITGAAQADVAILVVNATRGEFETGFEAGGQTREHAMLIRSLGVSQVLVAVNKMDTVEWSEGRFDDIVRKLGAFLKLTGFKETDVSYVPCSGLVGENLSRPLQVDAEHGSKWYHGPTLLEQIDKFKPPERPRDKPLRLCVTDVFKEMGTGFSVAGTIQAGTVQVGERVLVMPQGALAAVKAICLDEDSTIQFAFAGDSISLTLLNIDMAKIGVGSIICDPVAPIKSTTLFQARIVTFNIEVPITKGFPVIIHYQSMNEQAHVRKLVNQLHKSTGEVLKRHPRCLLKNTNAVIDIEVDRPICLELFKDFKDLGRFMLRYGGTTIAAGLVLEILNDKGSKAE